MDIPAADTDLYFKHKEVNGDKVYNIGKTNRETITQTIGGAITTRRTMFPHWIEQSELLHSLRLSPYLIAGLVTQDGAAAAAFRLDVLWHGLIDFKRVKSM